MATSVAAFLLRSFNLPSIPLGGLTFGKHRGPWGGVLRCRDAGTFGTGDLGACGCMKVVRFLVLYSLSVPNSSQFIIQVPVP